MAAEKYGFNESFFWQCIDICFNILGEFLLLEKRQMLQLRYCMQASELSAIIPETVMYTHWFGATQSFLKLIDPKMGSAKLLFLI